MLGTRNSTINSVINRKLRTCESAGDMKDLFGVNAFDVLRAEEIPKPIRQKLEEVAHSNKPLPREMAGVIATAVTQWALTKGCTHFCHWFQPLTGETAEKHDSFLSIDHGEVIEKISVSALMQGEPDASSFPHGGMRSTFEARGYTIWDLTSPMFIIEGGSGKTLYIPSAFISHHGEALDTKTPLLRSASRLNDGAKRLLSHLEPETECSNVIVTAGCEQEYFLIDKEFYYARPDLVMTGRTLLGADAPRHQQLEDHYFGHIPGRVLGFMQELDVELCKLGIVSKTRHNEVAPGQYEVAALFDDANRAADQNQLLMAVIKDVAFRHSFVALLHEKPFEGINGSGKHVNWSLALNGERNLLEPGKEPFENKTFLAFMAVTVEAVRRHAAALRMSVASAGNDHRLGENEAPPAIISVYLGEVLTKIFDTLRLGQEARSVAMETTMETGASQLAELTRHNTDRNRTSPFAFTGNRFEFRAVGSTMNVALPIAVLNAAVASVLNEACQHIEEKKANGMNATDAVSDLLSFLVRKSSEVVFDGDGYSNAWIDEAEQRGLPHLRSTPQALSVLKNKELTDFLIQTKVMSANELTMRYNILLKRYNTLREIEFRALTDLVEQTVLPTAFSYYRGLLQSKELLQRSSTTNAALSETISNLGRRTEQLFQLNGHLRELCARIGEDIESSAQLITDEVLPLSTKIAAECAQIEQVIPDCDWQLPKYREMLFIR